MAFSFCLNTSAGHLDKTPVYPKFILSVRTRNMAFLPLWFPVHHMEPAYGHSVSKSCLEFRSGVALLRKISDPQQQISKLTAGNSYHILSADYVSGTMLRALHTISPGIITTAAQSVKCLPPPNFKTRAYIFHTLHVVLLMKAKCDCAYRSKNDHCSLFLMFLHY